MDLIGFLYGFGALNGAALACILLYSRDGNRLANSFMAALVACIAIRFLNNWMIRTDIFMQHPEWGLASTPLDFAWGPLLYLYAFTMAGRRLQPVHALHLLPCLLLAAGPLTFVSYSTADQLQFLSYYWSDRQNTGLSEEVLSQIPAFWRVWVDMHLHGSFFTLQFGIYCYLVLRQVNKHNLSLEQHYSFTDEISLRWLRRLTYLCVFFLVLFLVFNRARLVLYGHFELTALMPNAPFLFMVLALYVIGIMALRQPAIEQAPSGSAVTVDNKKEPTGDDKEDAPEAAAQPAPEGESETGKSTAREKYARSGVSLEDAQRLKIQLMKTMQEQELYLNCDLTLGDLAEAAGMTYHQASQVINGQLNQKFFSFVNNYRIQRARELLAAPDTSAMPIVELAIEVGFKSKSSFYDAFKKATDMTPTQFRKSLENDA